MADDAALDILTGGGDLDWFVVGRNDVIKDLSLDESVTNISQSNVQSVQAASRIGLPVHFEDTAERVASAGRAPTGRGRVKRAM